jgi:hypothetical protein
MLKRIASDWSLWFLILFNLYLIWYYQQNPSSFKTLVWLYWMQSVVLGLYNALDIFVVKNPDPASMEIDGKPADGSPRSRGCMGLFFLVHYGGFHLAYAIFLLIQVHGHFESNVFLLGMGLIFIDQTFSFFRRRAWQKQQTFINIGKIFFWPYLRIIPMHLMILGPAFLGWNHISIFLWLKAFTDVLMHIFMSQPSQKTLPVTY